MAHPRTSQLGMRLALALALQPLAAHASLDADSDDLTALSLEELMSVEVTTVAGTGQARFATPAALYVITAEDIRRSGHRTIAEALRLVPGMYVARINANSWVIGARGLTGSSLTASRYLVMIDGRVVYDPLFSGTFWDVVDTALDDIDRIEVIRGPGATLWGVNGMNGVISVITKDAAQTQGTRVVVGAGSAERTYTTLRHGGTTGDTAWRAWAKYAQRSGFDLAAGGPAGDRWSTLRSGFRVDTQRSTDVRVTLQGDAYNHPVASALVRLPVPGQHQQFESGTIDDTVRGANLMWRLRKDDSDGSGWSAQAYYDHTFRDTSRIGVRRDTVDLDYRRWQRWSERNELIWGVQANRTEDDVDPGPSFVLSPQSRGWNTLNAFVQNTTELLDDRVYAMLGSKLTYHDFVGFATQPSARLWWTPSEAQTFWAAVSRPVRIPSRLEEDGLLIFSYVDTGLAAGQPASGVIVPVGLGGDDELRVEKLLAWELGHRIHLGEHWVLDTTLFYNDYSTLISIPPAIIGSFTDAGSGETYGVDVSASWRPTDTWRLEASYSWLGIEIDGPVFEFEETSTPQNLGQLRSQWDVGEAFEIDSALYYVDRVPRTAIDSYTRLDLGLAWRPNEATRLALWGQNLLDDEHQEGSGVLIPRSFLVQLTLDF